MDLHWSRICNILVLILQYGTQIPLEALEYLAFLRCYWQARSQHQAVQEYCQIHQNDVSTKDSNLPGASVGLVDVDIGKREMSTEHASFSVLSAELGKEVSQMLVGNGRCLGLHSQPDPPYSYLQCKNSVSSSPKTESCSRHMHKRRLQSGCKRHLFEKTSLISGQLWAPFHTQKHYTWEPSSEPVVLLLWVRANVLGASVCVRTPHYSLPYEWLAGINLHD